MEEWYLLKSFMIDKIKYKSSFFIDFASTISFILKIRKGNQKFYIFYRS